MPKPSTDVADEAIQGVYILSCIVRVWNEESSDELPPTWRGHITPVPNGERHYFTNLNEIPDLIVAHLKLQK